MQGSLFRRKLRPGGLEISRDTLQLLEKQRDVATNTIRGTPGNSVYAHVAVQAGKGRIDLSKISGVIVDRNVGREHKIMPFAAVVRV